MKKFEDLVLELYDKQNSKEYIVNNKYTFTGCVNMFNSGFGFARVKKEFLEDNINYFDSLYLTSNIDYTDKLIQKSLYVSHEYSGDTLKIKTRNHEYTIKLK